ncbi:YdcF family protein [Hyphomicrobiales bacterium]|nr:YdcF family protein [Hyphomicrobiales bacterium]
MKYRNTLIDEGDKILPTSVDAIVVFSGGSNRIENAVELLEKKLAKKLFISGVNPKTTKNDILIKDIGNEKLFKCCIDLGKNAINTFENATETAEWVDKNKFDSVILVTSNYHIKRSLIILKKINPNANFIPYPIKSTFDKDQQYIRSFDMLKVLSGEYFKLLYTRLRIMWL